jgi:hypothetical protein
VEIYKKLISRGGIVAKQELKNGDIYYWYPETENGFFRAAFSYRRLKNLERERRCEKYFTDDILKTIIKYGEDSIIGLFAAQNIAVEKKTDDIGAYYQFSDEKMWDVTFDMFWVLCENQRRELSEGDK